MTEARNWVKGLAVTLIAIPMAWLAGTATLSFIAERSNPSLALSFWSRNGVAHAARGEALLEKASQGRSTIATVRPHARAALEISPLNASGLRLLAFTATNGEADELIGLANRVSRRDLGTNLWLIEDAVKRGDVPRALEHYDRALRTSPGSYPLLFPTLAGALTDPKIRQAFAGFMREPAPWVPEFLAWMIAGDGDPMALGMLAIEARNVPSNPMYPDLDLRLLDKLVAAREFGLARQMFISRPGSDARILSSLAFTPPAFSRRNAPMGWQLANESGFVAQRLANGALSLIAASGERGIVARKLLFIKPGRYRISARIATARVSSNGGIQFSLSCQGLENEKTLWESGLLRSSSGSSVDATVEFPASCAAYGFDIRAIGGDGQTGSELELTEVRLDSAVTGA